jgi:hypothetical protein
MTANFPGLVTGTSIKSGGVKLVLYAQKGENENVYIHNT